jgi:phage gp29-like protein
MAEDNVDFKEYGATGIDLMDGRSYDEFLTELRGIRGLRTLREMAENDPISGAMLTALTNLTRAATFSTQPADESEEAQDAAGFMVDVFESFDEGYTFDDLINEACSMYTYGWAIQEVVYKRREDGNIGLSRLGIRVQQTIDKFELDDNNRVVGVWQDPTTGPYAFIPGDKIIHWTTTTDRGNPYGRSLLRNAYKSYYYKTQIQEVEALSTARELNGLPVVSVPGDLLSAAANGDKSAQETVDSYRKIARDLRFGSQAGVILPSDMYQNTSDANLQYSNNPKVSLRLLASEGTRNIDTDTVIKRYASDQARSILADMLLLGSDSRGSYALSQSKTDLFTQSVKAHVNRFVETINQQLIPKIWSVNGFDPNTMPKMVVSEIAPTDLSVLGDYVKSLAGAGVMISDEEAQNHLKTQAGIPTDNENEPEISDQGDDQVGG